MAHRVALWIHCLVAILLLLVQPFTVTASDKDDHTGLVQMNAEILKLQDVHGQPLQNATALTQQGAVPLKDLVPLIRSMVDIDLEGKGAEICGYVNQIATPMNIMLAASLDTAQEQMAKIIKQTTEAEKPLMAKIGGMSVNSSQRVAVFRTLVNTTVSNALNAMRMVGGPGLQGLLGTAIPILNATTYALRRMGLETAARKMNSTLWFGKEKGELIVSVIRKAPKEIAKYTDEKAQKYKGKLKELDTNVSTVMKAQMIAFDAYVNSWKDLILKMTHEARQNMTGKVPKECMHSVTAPLDSIESSVGNVSRQVVEVIHKIGHLVLEAETQAVAKMGLVEADSGAGQTTFLVDDEVLDLAEVYARAIDQMVISHHNEISPSQYKLEKAEWAEVPAGESKIEDLADVDEVADHEPDPAHADEVTPEAENDDMDDSPPISKGPKEEEEEEEKDQEEMATQEKETAMQEQKEKKSHKKSEVTDSKKENKSHKKSEAKNEKSEKKGAGKEEEEGEDKGLTPKEEDGEDKGPTPKEPAATEEDKEREEFEEFHKFQKWEAEKKAGKSHKKKEASNSQKQAKDGKKNGKEEADGTNAEDGEPELKKMEEEKKKKARLEAQKHPKKGEDFLSDEERKEDEMEKKELAQFEKADKAVEGKQVLAEVMGEDKHKAKKSHKKSEAKKSHKVKKSHKKSEAKKSHKKKEASNSQKQAKESPPEAAKESPPESE